MEDPVRVFGRTGDPPRLVSRYIFTSTWIHIPGTDWYMRDGRRDGDYRSMRIFSSKYRWIGSGIVLSSMVIERTRLIEFIQEFIDSSRPDKTRQDALDWARPRLEAWKRQLVLERFRRNRSARTIQRQFRESMSNPGYELCKRRLLREFADMI
jgi:hypothetical protein